MFSLVYVIEATMTSQNLSAGSTLIGSGNICTLGPKQIAVILQMTIANSFSWKKIVIFLFWNWFLSVRMAINQ